MKRMKRMKRRAISVLLTVSIASCAAMSAAGAPLTEALPTEWDLDSVYASVEEWQADYDAVMSILDKYEDFRGTLNTAQGIYDYYQFAYLTELTQKQEKLDLYASLGYYLDSTDPVFSNLQKQMETMAIKEAQAQAFAVPEIYELSYEERQEIFSDPLFADWQYAMRNYTDPDEKPFSEEVQQILAVKSAGEGYALRVFDILNNVTLPDPVIVMPDGTEQPLTEELYSDIIYSSEYGEDFKEQANLLLLTKPKDFVNTFAALLEENAVQKYAAAQINDYATTREYALDSYDVDPQIYDMLIDAAHGGAGDYQRYLAAHARGLGLEEQRAYHMADYVSDFDPGKTEYEDAVSEVAEALGVLGEEYMDTFMEIMESGHIDVYPTDTKATGAFEMQPSHEYLPWILFNYNGYSVDVSTIAHEMGHAVYDVYASENQLPFYASPTSFTHEIASTTNELLYYTYKMESAADEEEKLFYLENLLLMFSDTFFGQMWYAEFEDDMYQTVEAGKALDAEALSDKWMELMELYRGDEIKAYPDARYRWSVVPHFYYGYYVYQYAADVCYAASIVERITKGEEGAVEDYLSFLKLGASDSPAELLKAAGTDPFSRETYQYALGYFSDLVDEYERMIDAR